MKLPACRRGECYPRSSSNAAIVFVPAPRPARIRDWRWRFGLNAHNDSRTDFDLLVIGGGINGAGIARDAAGRGLRVCLCEQDDLGSHTSSKSTKLVHGGLRYLEHFEFRLVRESLAERETLLRSAPHIIWPLRFILPHDRSQRPVWMIRLGLWLYDRLGRRNALPGSHAVDLRHHAAGLPLDDRYRRAFEYSDCWVQDARLVVLAAQDAAERGAQVLTRTRVVSAKAKDSSWRIKLHSVESGRDREIRCRAVVNAAGPWAKQVLTERFSMHTDKRLRLVAGSHIIVPRLHEHAHAYIFQNPDQRIVFAIPYEQNFTLIGTTEREVTNVHDETAITREETDYLCRSVNRYFRRPVCAGEVVSTYTGVRALFDDASKAASKITRDYVLELERLDEAPLLSVFGGKITTFRRLAESAVDMICETLNVRAGGWTETASLPGGDLPGADFERFFADLKRTYPWLATNLAWRYARNYGTASDKLLSGVTGPEGLGEEIANGLFEAELDYLIAREWVRHADDLLWRRTKLGLHLSAAQREAVSARVAKAVPKAS